MKLCPIPRRAGFTLVELLSVIAIIAILAALLFPALNRASARANATRCLSNVRQWGAAANMYLSDNDGAFPGQGNTADAGQMADPNSTNAWYNSLPPYVGHETMAALFARRAMPRPGDKSLFICAAAPPSPAPQPTDKSTYYCSYSYNLWIDAGNRGCAGSGGSGFSRYLRFSQITDPSRFVLFAEGPAGLGENSNPGYRYAWTHPKYMAFPLQGDAFRHSGAANLCFADGHAGTYQKSKIYAEGMTAGTGQYWNYGGIQWNPDNPNLEGACN